METVNQPLPKGRTLPIDGEAVRTLRIERRMDMEQLARKAGCSRKTIENIERGGKRVYAVTLFEIATALDVQYAALFTGPIPSRDESDSKPQARRVSGVIVHFTLNFQNVDASDELIALMKKFAAAIGATAEIGVLSVKDGSLVVTLEMSEDDALRLVSAFGDRNERTGTWKLDTLGVSRIELAWTPELLRVNDALNVRSRKDFEAKDYEESHLHDRNRKDVWYLWKIAVAQNAMLEAGSKEKKAKELHRLVTEASTEGLMPKDEDLFIARFLLYPKPSLMISMPRVDRGGSVKLFRQAVTTEKPQRAAAAGTTEREPHPRLSDVEPPEAEQRPVEPHGKAARPFFYLDAFRRFLKRLRG